MSAKKELKQAYKEMQFRKGVFQLRNKRNNKVFIGSTMDLDRAWNSLRIQLMSGSHANEALQRDWQLQQGEDFIYEIVEVLQERDEPQTDYKQEIKTLEKLVMMELEPYGDKGYHQQRAGR
ncbi:GIY-YIG nuclease family protein [Chitinophaga nivalis]|uniref:GIY-YIG nuclease family protein n=1 Tax=Chitinophaga nivalis TaxID=2991709 RepID=A0ABT3IMT7_9BACT|nr:GIY-YIG nuclease family protein [Chitinophaga nivalis]MCW3465031.1 GIY-YIG nuclease family protein [Chitinophaga nivalis]MCW3485277.1 GIY-YIG nuclease family protein [Chitinophaga nivalis]